MPAIKIDLHTNVDIVKIYVKEIGKSLQICISALEDRVVEKLSPLKAMEDMSKGVAQTLGMHTCQNTALSLTLESRMLDTYCSKQTQRCWHLLAWVI